MSQWSICQVVDPPCDGGGGVWAFYEYQDQCWRHCAVGLLVVLRLRSVAAMTDKGEALLIS